ncbi:MAG: sulfurtransferase [Clostridiaceae bacterium]
MKNFKSLDFIKENPNLKIIDVRYDMSDGNYGITAYKKAHFKGAAFLDLDKDLAGPVKEHGGRHPLPEISVLEDKLRSIGLDNDTKVLIYDDGDNSSAGRLWWMLKYYGLKDVYVLNGGFKMIGEDLLTDHEENFERGNITLKPNDRMKATYDEVLQFSKENEPLHQALVDSRSEERYQGIIEPIDRKKGHIKNAKNVYFKSNFHADGTLKDKEILTQNFKEVISKKDIIVYCGSGVTACSNVMVLDELGISSRLYPGSFSDFVSYDENTVIKE